MKLSFFKSNILKISETPIKDRRKILLTCFLAFLISYNYTILKPIKDTLLIFPEDSGGEAIPFIKMWGILPFTVIFTFLFAGLSSKVSPNVVAAVFIALFASFFTMFTFVIYPYAANFQMDSLSEWLANAFPKGLRGLITVIKHWHFSLFYIMSEMWGIIIVHLIFWNFVINNATVSEGKKSYGLIICSFNCGSIVAGMFSAWLFDRNYFANGDLSTMWINITYITASILLSSIIILITFFSLHRHNESSLVVTKLPKISLIASIKFLFKIKSLLLIMTIVLSYNIINTFLEISWKNQMKTIYANPSAFCSYYGKIITATGITSATISFLALHPMLQKFSLKTLFAISPSSILLTALPFISLILTKNYLHINNLNNAILVAGSVMIVTMRSMKYTFFDAAKELSLTPLPQETKIHGKAVIDGISSRFGKSGASIVCQLLLIYFSTFNNILPIIFTIVIIAFIPWGLAIKKIDNNIDRKDHCK